MPREEGCCLALLSPDYTTEYVHRIHAQNMFSHASLGRIDDHVKFERVESQSSIAGGNHGLMRPFSLVRALLNLDRFRLLGLLSF